MKRRNFIFCTALGAGSLSSVFAHTSSQSPSSVTHLFKQYLSVINAQAEFRLLCDDQLSTSYTAASASYLKTGYKPYGSSFYFCDAFSTAICPLLLAPDHTGAIDISILFFRKDSKGKWLYCSAFSGFHLEGIIRALPKLDQNYSAAKLADLLVPASTAPADRLPDTIYTKSGALSLTVRIGDQKTTIDFRLTESNRDICLIKAPSSHALIYNSLA